MIFDRVNNSVYFVTVCLLILAASSILVYSAPSPDAIGIRVAPNPKHYSAARWYQFQGFKGSPQSLIVDGYEAIRDGRTVYVDVANVVEAVPANNELSVGDQFYTNIFIISYNQDAEKSTEDIFGQILANWKFNNNILKAGSCLDDSAKLCVYTSSCSLGDFCVSSHDVSVRDTKRLSDLTSMNDALANYRSKHDGLCPTLSSGSYIAHKSISTWTSWQESLGRELGTNLPFDPINQMGACPGHNTMTCWNEQAKKFAGTSTLNSIILPAGSHAYTYYSSPDGRSCRFYAATESRLNCVASGACTVGADISVSLDFSMSGPNRAPVVTCGNMVGMPHSPFSKFASANDLDPGDNGGLVWTIDTLGTVWTGWSAAPVLKRTATKNQREIFATQSGDKGSYDFKVIVTDERGSSTSKTCTIGLGSTLPELLPIANQSVYSGEVMNAFTIFASEPDKDYPMTFTFTGDNLDTGATVNNIFTCGSVSPVFGEPNGRFNCHLNQQTVNQPGGNYQITVKATDKSGDFNTITYTLNIINDAPALTANNIVWEASSTAPVGGLVWEATDLQSNLPIAFSNVPAWPNGIVPATVVVNRPNANVTYKYGAANTINSVAVQTLQYSVSGKLDNTNIFNAPVTTFNMTAAATDNFGANSSKAYTVKINNSAPVVGPLGCAGTTRHSNPYSCSFPVSDANGNAISGHISAGLPAGVASVLAGNNITISGLPALISVGPHNISVNATDEFGYTGANASYNLNVVTYCGDNIVQNPNGEGGAESCDINAGIAPNPAGSLATKQYACTAACTQTGGWCGDAVIQAGNGEFCDGATGIAPNPAGSLVTKQYACTAACTQTGGWCGDAVIQAGNGEFCDGATGIAPNPAGSLATKQYACSAACTQTGGWCGDTIIQGGNGELCDGATGIAATPAASSPGTQYSCTSCAPSGGYCGDGAIQGAKGEVCDGIVGVAATPAASSPAKQYACSGSCAFTAGYCGDGVMQAAHGESCDDGNNVSWDGCSSVCANEIGLTQIVACPAVPVANASFNSLPTLLQTFTAAAPPSWQPPAITVYNAVPGNCTYACNAGFSWDGSTCVNYCTFDVSVISCTFGP